ncbi:MAG: SDR family oxidoreductase [Pseudomonadota bacterium]
MCADKVELPLALPPEALGQAPGRSRLEERRILVVGAGQRENDDADAPIGNGRATAMLCAREGAVVACADRDLDAAQETTASIKAEGANAIAIEADASVEEDVNRMVEAAADSLGGLDGLVMNVGVGIAQGQWLAGTSVDDWDKTFAINTRGHFLSVKKALEVLEPGSSIVFVSSIASIKPGSRLPAYDASKAALTALNRHVAFEGARAGIRSNVVVLGLIDTPLGRLATAGRPNRAKTPVPLGRQATAWEVAYATVFLLSNEASYINGHELVIDAGLTSVR